MYFAFQEKKKEKKNKVDNQQMKSAQRVADWLLLSNRTEE